MKKQTPVITDEHIVAYLDGELSASGDFTREIASDPALKQSAAEYATITKAFAASAADSRFSLRASVDERTKNVLRDAITKFRKTVRTAMPSPSAAPEHGVSPVRSIKYLWAKRVGIGFALAGLAVSLWFNFNGKKEEIAQAPQKQMTAPQAPVIIPTAPVAIAPSMNVAENSHQVPQARTAKAAHKTATAQNVAANNTTEAPPPAIREETKTAPGDIMISRRFAKMLKSTPPVDVTDQDKLPEQM